MNWSASASSPWNWLSISPSSGTVNTPFVDISTVYAAVNAANLANGTYYGQIKVTSPGFANLFQTISVVLPMGSNPGPELRPSGLIFAGPKGATQSAQTVMISNLSAD